MELLQFPVRTPGYETEFGLPTQQQAAPPRFVMPEVTQQPATPAIAGVGALPFTGNNPLMGSMPSQPSQPSQPSGGQPHRSRAIEGAPMFGVDMSPKGYTSLVHGVETQGIADPYTARNMGGPKGRKATSASGKYQWTDTRWNGYKGYKHAWQAPAAVQEARWAEDMATAARKYGNDGFKMMADRYLPALANDPSRWGESVRLKQGRDIVTVEPVMWYLRQTLRNSPELLKRLDDYYNAHTQ